MGVARSVQKLALVPARTMKIIFIVMNLILYSSFVLLVVLFEELPKDSQLYCGNRFFSTPAWPPRKIVNLVYRALIALVSLALSIGFLISGSLIYHTLRTGGAHMSQNQAKKSNTTQKIKIFWMTVISSVGLLLQSIFLLIIISIQNNSNTVTIIILLIVEVIPSFCILLFIDPRGPLSRASRFNPSTYRSSSTEGSNLSSAGTRKSHKSSS